jgi:hypothetical protein
LKAARAFQDRCVRRGVPLEALREVPNYVRLTRVIGNGSPFARQQSVGSLIPLSTEMGPRGRRNFQDDYVAAFAGGSKVDRYFPKEDILEVPDMNTWVAEQENGYMNDDGALPTITDGMDHRVHLRIHILGMNAAIQAAMQGGELPKVLTFLQVAFQHVAQHLQYLNPEEQKQWMEALKPLEQGFELLQQQFQKQQQEQQQNQQAMQQTITDEQIQMMKVQLDAQRKDQKQAMTMEQKQLQQQQNMALADAKTASEIARKNAVAASDIRRANVETATDIARSNAEARSKPKE